MATRITADGDDDATTQPTLITRIAVYPPLWALPAANPHEAAVTASAEEWERVRKQVAAGIEWAALQGYTLEALNVEAFDIRSDERCALGQWYGSYDRAAQMLVLRFPWACAHGFVSDDSREMDMLQFLWCHAIRDS